MFTKKNNLRKKPSSTSLATPIYHRRRRDWRDDQYLIEEIVKSLGESKEAKKNKVSTQDVRSQYQTMHELKKEKILLCI